MTAECANVSFDWTVRENVRAQLHWLVKHILCKYGYRPDKQEKATHTVLEQGDVVRRMGVGVRMAGQRHCMRLASLHFHPWNGALMWFKQE